MKEDIYHLLPKRKTLRGRKPTISSKVLSGPIQRIKEVGTEEAREKIGRKMEDIGEGGVEEGADYNWQSFWREYSKKEKVILAAKCIQERIEVVFQTHTYRFHNVLYWQR